MTQTEIFETLILLLRDKFNVATESVTPQTTLTELGLDSLSLMEFIFAAEDAFSLRIPEEKLDPREAATNLAGICEIISSMISR
jgi:acyl carrier protein